MTSLIAIIALPLLMSFVGFAAWKMPFYRQIIAACAWYQVGLEAYLFRDILLNGSETLAFLEGFSADRISALFALLSTLVVAASLSHACVFFKNEGGDQHRSVQRRVGLFYACTSLFLLAMILLCICSNLGYMWICIETTTLVSAPLVYFSRNKHSLEATWKYLMICSVGIAFALLGTIMIFASSQQGGAEGTLQLSELTRRATTLDYPLLRMGFIFCFLGYGTKAGVFPIHSWLPDAHSEAPAPASAMLSGALLNCALLVIWRLAQLVTASGHPDLAHKLPLLLGTLTVAAASFFLIKQDGIKRMLAYSSIENVGLMLIAIAFGSAPVFFLQALNHSLSKVAAFLLAGNFIQLCGTKKLSDLKGLLLLSPHWAILIALAAFAVTGAPPFGSFISEWYLLCKSVELNLWPVFGILIASLAISFLAVSYYVANSLWGAPSAGRSPVPLALGLESSFIPAVLILCTLAVGITPLATYIIQLFS